MPINLHSRSFLSLLALQTAAYGAAEAYPLDMLDAESEGMIDYLVEQELRNELGGGALIATLLTQIEIDPKDPAFKTPSKPIGPVYDALYAEVEAANHGWSIAPEGDSLRRMEDALTILEDKAGTVVRAWWHDHII